MKHGHVSTNTITNLNNKQPINGQVLSYNGNNIEWVYSNNKIETNTEIPRTKTGVLIPAFFSPTNPVSNDAFNTIIKLSKKYHTIPIVVILNPNNGPNTIVDEDYTHVINRMVGACITPIGYVYTSYMTRPLETVLTDIDTWTTLYPEIQGIWVDEMKDWGMKRMTQMQSLHITMLSMNM